MAAVTPTAVDMAAADIHADRNIAINQKPSGISPDGFLCKRKALHFTVERYFVSGISSDRRDYSQ